jgi:type VI secretion system protein ImpK
MRDAIANVVYPVLLHGLRLRERLDAGDQPDLDLEQAALKERLGPAAQTRPWAGPGADPRDPGESINVSRGPWAPPDYLYALVCWLDEIFIDDSPWGKRWQNQLLEWALYRSRDAAHKFWDLARRAEARSVKDELEVFYLCVMLGFRGDLREDSARLRAWRNAVETRLKQNLGAEWTVPPGKDPPEPAPARRGRERLQRMILTAAAVLLVLVPVAMFYLIRQFE